jgi:hypothetical protein
MKTLLGVIAALLILGVVGLPDFADAKIKWPKKLRVQLKSPGELLPPCWGRPQECRDKGTANPKAEVPDYGPPPEQYYIVTQFQCASRRTGKPTGGDCVRSTWSAKSCAAALAEMNRVAKGPDVCRTCDEIIDNDKYWTGKRDNSQGGPCWGM